MQKSVSFNPSVAVNIVGPTPTTVASAVTTPASTPVPQIGGATATTATGVQQQATGQGQAFGFLGGVGVTPVITTAPAATSGATGSVVGTAPTATVTTSAGTNAQTTSSTTTTASTSSTQGFDFGFRGTATSSASGLTSGATTASTSSQGQANQSTSANPQQQNVATEMSFQQLQEVLNDYMAEIQEQEELFHDKVREVNDTDRMLEANGEKIAALQSATDSLKKDHVRISGGLNYLQNQQAELDNVLATIEQSMPSAVPSDDPERVRLSEMVVTVDRQLLQMGLDLRQVIEKINERNSLNARSLPNDPLAQIMKILNEHTDALLWIEKGCSNLKIALSDVSQEHINLKVDYVNSMRRGRAAK